MAKIYETEKDKRREEVSRHVDLGSAIQGAGQSTLLFSAFTAILAFAAKGFIPEKAKNLFGGSMRKGMETMGWFATGMTGASIASMIAGNRIKKQACAELDKLGPEKIIDPCCAGDYIKTKTNHAQQVTEQQVALQSILRNQ